MEKVQIGIRSVKLLFILFASIISISGFSQSKVGLFDGSTDIGNCEPKGSVIFNPKTQEYTITGSGNDIWDKQDAFHFLWKKMNGDFVLQFEFSFVGEGKNPGRKVGWMVRNDTSDNSAHINGMVHGFGLTCIQYRQTKGGTTAAIDSKAKELGVVRFERKGNVYILSTAAKGKDFITLEYTDSTHFVHNEAFVGIYLCSHENGTKESAIIRNVSITIPKTVKSK